MLQATFATNKKRLTVTRLSDTRWSVRADANRAVKNGYKKLLYLRDIDFATETKTLTRVEANVIASQLDDQFTVPYCIFF